MTMTLSQSAQDDMCQKLRMVGLPKAVVLPLVNSLSFQIACEGPENVVKRLKVLKQAAVNSIAGQSYDLSWISHNQHGPKGPWRPVWRMLQSQHHKMKKRALNTMMVYASLVLPKRASPTLTQERKFLSSVHHSKEEVDLRQKVLLEAYSLRMFAKGLQAITTKLRSVPVSNNGIKPILEFLAPKFGTDEKSAGRAERHLQTFLSKPTFYPFHAFPQVKETLGQIGEDYFDLTAPWNGSKLDWRTQSPPDGPIGVIGSSQEPGYKFRAFASPNLVLQSSLERLKSNLQEALKTCPWDCTYDQEKGVLEVQRWLRDGKTCFSVDLSDATNNFPLDLQLVLLRKLQIQEEDIKLLEMVSRSPYRLTWGEKELTSWDVGQPLGAGPSFMAFALTHAAVALDAALVAHPDWGVEQAGRSFLILGDDFITNDERVHTEYRRRLRVLSCPISESKCLVSNLSGEFAGKLITKDTVFHGFKFKEVSNRSFLSVVRTLGPQAISKKLLSREQYEYCHLVRELPEPYGLGFNPKGRSFSDRYEEYLYLKEREDQVRPDTRSATPSELVNKLHYKLKSRFLTYFPNVGVLREDASDLVRLHGSLKNSLMKRIRKSAELVSIVKTDGDPRPDPLQGWHRKTVQEIIPVLERVRESQSNLSRSAFGGSYKSQVDLKSVTLVLDQGSTLGQTSSERNLDEGEEVTLPLHDDQVVTDPDECGSDPERDEIRGFRM